jgi:type VI secretion system secreted protein VgrG
VIDNHDPQGLGRVKVQMRWQYKNGLSTPWIRNLSVSASQGQGFYFIPEVDDEVLVDFEGGNAECPFVVGSVYNSDSKPPSASSNSSNHIKMIQSRNGGIFKINDQDGSITIQDKSGSSIVLDGSGNINIQATKSIILTAGEDINATSGKNTTLNTDKDFNVNAGNNTTITTSSKLNVSSGRNTQINDGIKIEITAPSVGVKGDAGLKLEGATVDIDGKAITNVKGGMVNLN